jgi:N-acetylglucosaminyl-diphospho-decaprenol L-rhamnosyltransferase
VLAVVLVHWNQPERCLKTVAAFQGQGLPVRITVVDNASEDAARDRLAAELPDDVELVDAGGNLGFGPGANVGLRRWLVQGDGEWVVVAPHDALPGAGCLRALLDAVTARPLAGLACADVGDGHTPYLDPYFGGITMPAGEDVATDGWQPADYPHGTLLLARRTCLEEIGVFDERYFAYCEEADLGLRARAAGWHVGIVRTAQVRNPYLASHEDVVDYLMLRNTLLLVREHFGRYRSSVRFCIALWHLADGYARPNREQWIFAPKARVRALRDYGRGRFGPPPSLFTRGQGPSIPSSSTP